MLASGSRQLMAISSRYVQPAERRLPVQRRAKTGTSPQREFVRGESIPPVGP
jgi:hypothetical protein